MKHRTLISFCIASYKRPEFLKKTIEAILNQKYDNIEIIISEDNSDKTSEDAVKIFKSNRIIYYKNEKHLGMVKSYNKAISLSKGDFIVLLADDDPPTNGMIEVFMNALGKYPKIKAFWGGSSVNINTDKIEKVTHLRKGFNSLINKNKKRGTIEILTSKDFFKKFFKQEIFPHYQWTTAVIAKDIVDKIKSVPDYNSAHFIDYAYLLKIAALTDFVIINKELGAFNLHEYSYGKRKDTLEEYKRGVLGFDKEVSNLADKLDSTQEYKNFLINYIIMFLINRFEHYKIHDYKIDTKTLMKVYDDLSKNLTFLKDRRKELYFRLNFPYSHNLISAFRNLYGKVKVKL